MEEDRIFILLTCVYFTQIAHLATTEKLVRQQTSEQTRILIAKLRFPG